MEYLDYVYTKIDDSYILEEHFAETRSETYPGTNTKIIAVSTSSGFYWYADFSYEAALFYLENKAAWNDEKRNSLLVIETADYKDSRLVILRSELSKHKYVHDEEEISRRVKEGCQKPYTEFNLSAIKDESGWALVDYYGCPLTDHTYDDIILYPNGTIVACKNGLYGYLNNEGKESIKLQYQDAGPFANGYACVKSKGRWFLIDEIGIEKAVTSEMLSPLQAESEYCQYYRGSLSEGFAGVFKPDEGIMIPARFHEVQYAGDDIFVVKEMEYSWWSLLDVNGRRISDMEFDKVTFFSHGTSVVTQVNWKDERREEYCYAIDSRGHHLLPAAYPELHLCSDLPIFVAGAPDDVYHKIKFGLIDMSGKTLLPFEYDKLEYIGKCSFLGTVHSEAHLIHLHDDVCSVFEFDECKDMVNGKYVPYVETATERSKNMVQKIKQKIKRRRDGENCILLRMIKNGKMGLVDHLGKEILPFEFSYITKENEGMVLAGHRLYPEMSADVSIYAISNGVAEHVPVDGKDSIRFSPLYFPGILSEDRFIGGILKLQDTEVEDFAKPYKEALGYKHASFKIDKQGNLSIEDETDFWNSLDIIFDDIQ